jgi:hypothetical protein
VGHDIIDACGYLGVDDSKSGFDIVSCDADAICKIMRQLGLHSIAHSIAALRGNIPSPKEAKDFLYHWKADNLTTLAASGVTGSIYIARH